MTAQHPASTLNAQMLALIKGQAITCITAVMISKEELWVGCFFFFSCVYKGESKLKLEVMFKPECLRECVGSDP